LIKKKQKIKAVFAKPKNELHYTKMKKLTAFKQFSFSTFRSIPFFNGFPNKASPKGFGAYLLEKALL
jgi:hypothetical protein